jgi:hypothetical protein
MEHVQGSIDRHPWGMFGLPRDLRLPRLGLRALTSPPSPSG